MAYDFDADLTEMLDTDEHATSATYTPVGGSAATVKGIFDQAQEHEEVGIGIDLELTNALFHCKKSDLTGTFIGGTMVINSTTYLIKAETVDEAGLLSTLTLQDQT